MCNDTNNFFCELYHIYLHYQHCFGEEDANLLGVPSNFVMHYTKGENAAKKHRTGGKSLLSKTKKTHEYSPGCNSN